MYRDLEEFFLHCLHVYFCNFLVNCWPRYINRVGIYKSNLNWKSKYHKLFDAYSLFFFLYIYICGHHLCYKTNGYIHYSLYLLRKNNVTSYLNWILRVTIGISLLEWWDYGSLKIKRKSLFSMDIVLQEDKEV